MVTVSHFIIALVILIFCGETHRERIAMVKRFTIIKKIDGTWTQFNPTISGEASMSANFATSDNVWSEKKGQVLFF